VKKLKIDLRTYTMIFALFTIWVVFAMLTNRALRLEYHWDLFAYLGDMFSTFGKHGFEQGMGGLFNDFIFLSPRNLSNLFVQMTVVGVLAVGMVLIIVSGNIDLSVGSVSAFIGGLVTVILYETSLPPFAAVLIGLAAGAGIGFIQGGITAYFRVPAFIVTLGGMMIFRGATMWILGGQDKQFMAGWVNRIGDGYLPDNLSLIILILGMAGCAYWPMRNRAARIRYGFSAPSSSATMLKGGLYAALVLLVVVLLYGYNGIPISVFILLALVMLVTFMANRTRFGRHIYAIGGNIEAAHLSGINVKWRLTQAFMLIGALSAMAGVILTSYVGSASQKAGGLKELDAIAACVIGGTSLMGGKGSIPGAILGALIMASLDNGLDLVSSPPATRYMIKGGVLIIAVLVDMLSQKDK
jgi:D-xylose transport system permease protein